MKTNTILNAVYIKNLYWEEPVGSISRSYPPSAEFRLQVKTPSRMISIVPTSWSDFYKWTAGLTLLLQQSFDDEEHYEEQHEKSREVLSEEDPEVTAALSRRGSPTKSRQTLHKVTSSVAGLSLSPRKSPRKKMASYTSGPMSRSSSHSNYSNKHHITPNLESNFE